MNFQSVKNSVIIFYESGLTEVIYTKDLLIFVQFPTKYEGQNELRVLE